MCKYEKNYKNETINQKSAFCNGRSSQCLVDSQWTLSVPVYISEYKVIQNGEI